MQFLYLGIAAAFIWKLLASGAQDAGQAIDNTGSGALKGVGALVLAYGALKYFKVMK